MATEKDFQNAKSNLRAIAFLQLLGAGLLAIGVVAAFGKVGRLTAPSALLAGLCSLQLVASFALSAMRPWGRLLSAALNGFGLLWLLYEGITVVSKGGRLDVVFGIQLFFSALFVYVLLSRNARIVTECRGDVAAALARESASVFE